MRIAASPHFQSLNDFFDVIPQRCQQLHDCICQLKISAQLSLPAVSIHCVNHEQFAQFRPAEIVHCELSKTFVSLTWQQITDQTLMMPFYQTGLCSSQCACINMRYSALSQKIKTRRESGTAVQFDFRRVVGGQYCACFLEKGTSTLYRFFTPLPKMPFIEKNIVKALILSCSFDLDLSVPK